MNKKQIIYTTLAGLSLAAAVYSFGDMLYSIGKHVGAVQVCEELKAEVVKQATPEA